MKHIADIRQQRTWETLGALLTRLLGADSAAEIIKQSRLASAEYTESLGGLSLPVRDELTCVILPRICVLKELKRHGIDASAFAGIYFHEIMEPVISGRLEAADELVAAFSGIFSKLQSGVGSVGHTHSAADRESRKELWDKTCTALGCAELCELFRSGSAGRVFDGSASGSLAYLSDRSHSFTGTHFFGGHGTLE